jgi:hypothetical protein
VRRHAVDCPRRMQHIDCPSGPSSRAGADCRARSWPPLEPVARRRRRLDGPLCLRRLALVRAAADRTDRGERRSAAAVGSGAWPEAASRPCFAGGRRPRDQGGRRGSLLPRGGSERGPPPHGAARQPFRCQRRFPRRQRGLRSGVRAGPRALQFLHAQLEQRRRRLAAGARVSLGGNRALGGLAPRAILFGL